MQKILAALLALLLPVLLAACGAESPAVAAAPPPAGPALWKVEGDAGSAWLFGSVHALRASDLPLPERVMQAYRGSDAVLMELDMDDLDPAAIQRMTLEMGTFPNGKTLREALPPQLYQRLHREADELGVPMQGLDRFEPWLVALVIQQARLRKLDFHPEQGIDTLFTAEAVNDGKPVEGLESLEYQLQLFDGLPADKQQLYLEQTLKEEGKTEKQLNRIVKAWQTGDTEAMAALAREGFADDPLLYERLVIDRNREWTTRIDRQLEDRGRTLFVVVGALHLAGDHNVIDMLREQGYTVVRK